MQLIKIRRQFLATLIFCTVFFPVHLSAAEMSNEYQAKAVLLYNIINFTRWPDNTFANETSAYSICILGEDPYSDIFAQMSDWKVKGRSLKTRQLQTKVNDQALQSCHILIIRLTKQSDILRFTEKSQSLSILSISEQNNDRPAMAMINFSIVQSRISFSVNRSSANSAQIDFSSQMLRLASQVN